MNELNKNILVILGKLLQFCGDNFCAFALLVEEKGSGKFGNIVITKISNIFWKLGLWFYKLSDKYAWSHLMTPNNFPPKRYDD